MKFRPRYDLKTLERVRKSTTTVNNEPSMTKPSFEMDTDINILVRRFNLDGATPIEGAFDPRFYGDITNAPDLRTVLDNVRIAEERFQALPAALREQFRNSSAELWAFLNNPANNAKAVQLGLLKELIPPSDPEPGKKPPASGSEGVS